MEKKDVNEVEVKKLSYVIVRTSSAGCFAGYLKKEEKDVVVLENSRRLWYWEGAASLSQLSMEGTSKPEKCKFPQVEELKKIFGVIEIIWATEKARKNIEAVPIWKF